MNKTVGFQLAACSLLLAGLSYLAYHLAPTAARSTLITGLAGAALCLIWSLRAIAGSRGKALAILTLIPVCFALLPQTFTSWSGASLAMQAGRTVAVLTTLLLVLSVGMLVRIAWAGVVFDVPPGTPAQDGGTKPPTARKPAAEANPFRGA